MRDVFLSKTGEAFLDILYFSCWVNLVSAARSAHFAPWVYGEVTRTFDAMGVCSKPHAATIGILEGCGFAVPCMFVITTMLFKLAQIRVPGCQIVMSSDMLAFFTSSVDMFKDAPAVFQTFTDQLKVTMCGVKPWSWVRHPQFKVGQLWRPCHVTLNPTHPCCSNQDRF